jgi:hypothetical protein
MWINKTPVPVIIGGNILCKWNYASSEKIVKYCSLSWTDKKKFAETNPGIQVMWLQSMNYNHLVWQKKTAPFFWPLIISKCWSLLQGVLVIFVVCILT